MAVFLLKYRPQKFSQYSVGGFSGQSHLYNNNVD